MMCTILAAAAVGIRVKKVPHHVVILKMQAEGDEVLAKFDIRNTDKDGAYRGEYS